MEQPDVIPSKQEDEAKQPVVGKDKYCKNFARKGRCKWGDDCKFLHAQGSKYAVDRIQEIPPFKPPKPKKKKKKKTKEEKEEDKATEWSVNMAHLSEEVVELCEEEVTDLKDVTSNALLDLCGKTTFNSDELALYSGLESDSSRKSRLNTVVNYAETETKASKAIKNKLRFVTKRLTQDNDGEGKIDPAACLLLLCAHGNMCNIMKETAINFAYSALVGNLGEVMDKTSVKMSMLRLLYAARTDLVEQVFIKEHGGSVNVHPLNEFRNNMSAKVGLKIFVEPDYPTNKWGSHEVKEEHYTSFFGELYTVDFIVKLTLNALNQTPRKLSYQAVIEYFQQHSPVKNKYNFLAAAFDMDTGHLTEKYAKWFLRTLKVLSGPPLSPTTLKELEEEEDDEDVGDLKLPPMVRQLSIQELQSGPAHPSMAPLALRKFASEPSGDMARQRAAERAKLRKERAASLRQRWLEFIEEQKPKIASEMERMKGEEQAAAADGKQR
eukprot:gb/GEZN01005032.1/.p1 GENE.gb/GEZN01005032.1/~~gb/GEZN01005032.1/.p1  ORF type:complete len:494 (-),score=91.39 gb/GEZN01005032.1/:361-1842(-)